MLVRSAGQRQRRHTSRILAASFAKLQLPWLAPAQLRWNASQSTTPSPSPSRTRRISTSKSSRPSAQLRGLATTSDQHTLNYESTLVPPSFRGETMRRDHVSWDSTITPSSQEPASTDKLRRDLVMIDTSTISPPRSIKVQHGVNGNVREMLAHLHTSLSVGRRDRARAIIERLNERCGPSSAELSYAHTTYLEEIWKSIQNCPEGSRELSVLQQELQQWFETAIRDRGVRIDGRMLVVMIRAAIRALDKESSRDRAIRRYADMAETQGAETLDEVLFSDDYTDEEFTIIAHVTSEFFEPSEDALAATAEETEPDTQSASLHGESAQADQTPEVLPTQQKGYGLSTVKQTLSSIADLPQLPDDAPQELRQKNAYEKQQALEHASVELALERWRRADADLRKLGISTVMQNKPISALIWQWYQALVPALEEELAATKLALSVQDSKSKETDRHYYGPYLESLPLDKVAANAIIVLLSKLSEGKDQQSGRYETEAKLNHVTMAVAKTLEQESQAEASMRKNKHDFGLSRAEKKRQRRSDIARRLAGRSKSTRTEPDNEAEENIKEKMAWPLNVKVKLGAMVVAKVFETAQLPVTKTHPRTGEKVTQMQPAFLHRVKYYHGKRIGMVTPNPALTQKIQGEPLGSLIAKRMPMVVEPQPWTGWSKGGYLHYSNPIMRLSVGDKTGQDYFLAAHRKGDLEKVYTGLNALGKVPWKVHRGVFDTQLEAWNSGEEIANFAPFNPEFVLPPEPDSSADATRKRSWLYEVRDIENKKTSLHSKRCFQNFQLEVARSLLNETLYFPHNIDFRGRAYPIPPYLNHMGADNVRGLLMFANGKELGQEGLRWLKIHLATVAGFDKASLEERVEFTMSHLDDIYDSARSPLGGRRWWLQSSDAWQTLAACFELTEALKSPDPTKFVSHLPVQQDGTCNGLQHYAALGGDAVGAAQVNLEPGDRPADVYTAVAEAVKEEVRKDAADGNPIAQKLDGHITRKCVKQPVMTNVYGVTFFGARQQVRKQIEEIFPNIKRDDEINYVRLSHYIAAKIFKSLGSMFSGAQSIQSWLGQCADRISMCLMPEQIEQFLANGKTGAQPKGLSRSGKKEKVDRTLLTSEFASSSKPLFKSTVIWTTPLGLPVVQPYRKSKMSIIQTCLQRFSISDPQVWDPVSRRKQLQAFPPNFIHSLDATHMMLSAQKCDEHNLTFASIHDSFWTHACDVGTMSTVLRDAFVSMHSEDIIGRLREEFQARYKGAMYMASVRADSEVGKQIHAYRKAHSNKKTRSELELEIQRLRLLESEDAEEKARGEAMVTPASIVAAFGGESSFAMPAEVESQALGRLPEGDKAKDAKAAKIDDGDESSIEADLGEVEAFEDGIDEEDHADEDEPPASKKAAKYPSSIKKTHVWLPITFPEVPQKGDFDVSRLRQSRYFFH